MARGIIKAPMACNEGSDSQMARTFSLPDEHTGTPIRVEDVASGTNCAVEIICRETEATLPNPMNERCIDNFLLGGDLSWLRALSLFLQLLKLKGMFFLQVSKRNLAGEPNPTHWENTRLEVDMVKVPDNNCQEGEERFVTVDQASDVPDPKG